MKINVFLKLVWFIDRKYACVLFGRGEDQRFAMLFELRIQCLCDVLLCSCCFHCALTFFISALMLLKLFHTRSRFRVCEFAIFASLLLLLFFSVCNDVRTLKRTFVSLPEVIQISEYNVCILLPLCVGMLGAGCWMRCQIVCVSDHPTMHRWPDKLVAWYRTKFVVGVIVFIGAHRARGTYHRRSPAMQFNFCEKCLRFFCHYCC